MTSLGEIQKIKSSNSLESKGSCKIPGSIFDLGEYPGLVLGGNSIVQGELFEIKDIAVFKELDNFEKYDPRDRINSLYIRRCIRLVEPKKDA